MLLRILSLFLGVSLLAACNSGGRYLQTGGKMCASNLAPISLTIDKATKVSIEPSEGDLFAGQYVYDGADIFYYNPNKGERVYFQDLWSAKSKSFVMSPVCASGLTPAGDFSASISGVSSIEVENSSKSTFKVREYLVEFKNKTLIRKIKDESSEPFSSPSKVFDNNITEYNFYKKTETTYELRVKAVNPADQAQIWLAIRYVKKPLPEDQKPGGLGGG